MNAELKAELDRCYDRIRSCVEESFIWQDLVSTYREKGNTSLERTAVDKLTQIEIDLFQANAHYASLMNQWSAPTQARPANQPSFLQRILGY